MAKESGSCGKTRTVNAVAIVAQSIEGKASAEGPRAASRAQDTTEKPMAISRKRIRAARDELVRRGVLVDSGQRALNPRTGELEICWRLNPALRKEEMDALVEAPDLKQ